MFSYGALSAVGLADIGELRAQHASSRARSEAMRSVGMKRTRSGAWEVS
jgi:hypothetical protein